MPLVFVLSFLCSDIADLNQIQQDIAKLVVEQGDDVNNIGKYISRQPVSIVHLLAVKLLLGISWLSYLLAHGQQVSS